MSSRSSRERRRQENWQERREQQGLHARHRGSRIRPARHLQPQPGSDRRSAGVVPQGGMPASVFAEAVRNGWVVGVAPADTGGVETTGYSQPVGPAQHQRQADLRSAVETLMLAGVTQAEIQAVYEVGGEEAVQQMADEVAGQETARQEANNGMSDYVRARLREEAFVARAEVSLQRPLGLRADSYSFDEVQAIRGVSLPGVVYDEMDGIPVPEAAQAALRNSRQANRAALQEASRRAEQERQAAAPETAPRNGSTGTLTSEDLLRAWNNPQGVRSSQGSNRPADGIAGHFSATRAQAEAALRAIRDRAAERSALQRPADDPGRLPVPPASQHYIRGGRYHVAFERVQTPRMQADVAPLASSGTFDGSVTGRSAALNEAIQVALRPYVGRDLTPALLAELERVSSGVITAWEEQEAERVRAETAQERGAAPAPVLTFEQGIAVANLEGISRVTFGYEPPPPSQTLEDVLTYDHDHN